MGFTYRIDEDQQIVFVKASGTVTSRELCLHWLQFIEDSRASALRRTLVDLSDADVLIDLQDLHLLIEQLVRPRIGDAIWTSAFVVREGGSQEMAQHFQLLAQFFSRDRMFRDSGEATAWLLRQPVGARGRS